MDELNQLQVIRRVKQSFDRNVWRFNTSFYLGKECVQTFDSLESAEDPLRDFFQSCGMGFEEWEEFSDYRNTVRILRMVPLNDFQAELIFDIYEKESIYDENKKSSNFFGTLIWNIFEHFLEIVRNN